jgi:TPP-dependent pyruvate/acetoin dehydrogenase alpha subunit
METKAKQDIENAVEYAKNSPDPDPADLLTDVYAD